MLEKLYLMKYIHKIILLLLSALSVTSCEFLDSTTKGVETEEAYFSTAEECDKYVIGVYYRNTCHVWYATYAWWVMSDMCTDDMWVGNTSQPAKHIDWVPIAHFQGTSSASNNTYLDSFWESRYRSIFMANTAIYRIADAPIDEDLKNRLIAECKFLRGYFYFDLVKNFGGVPLVLRTLAPNELHDVERSCAEQIYKQIKDDLKDAAKVLPYKKDMDYESGRANRGMAEALLAKVHLYCEEWQEAYDAAKRVIDYGGYALEKDFMNVWSQKDNSPEAIFEIQTSSNPTYTLGCSLPVITGCRDDKGWSWGQPTSHLENAFIAAGDEIRRRASIIVNGETPYGTTGVGAYTISPTMHKSGRIIRKFFLEPSQRPLNYQHNRCKLNYHILRYADVLLMASEAAYQLKDEDSARDYLNEVRERVKLDDVESSGEALYEAIKLERRLELAFEANRLYDLRRWKDASGASDLSKLMGPNGTFVKYNTKESTDPYETTNQIESSSKGSSYMIGRDELFPLPYAEIQLSGGKIKQNPNFN